MASSLPMFVVLQSKHNGKYLECLKEEGEYHGYVRCTGVDVHSAQSKFQVERAATDSQLVHLRCCYNNKFLVSFTEDYNYIVSEADKREEDQSKWTCTLFQPIPVGNDYAFKHVGTGNYAALVKIGGKSAKDYLVYPESEDLNSIETDVFNVIDWKLLVVLPRRVAFKGDNGSYLTASYLGGPHHFLHFGASDSGDAGAAHEVYPNPDGSIRLLSAYHRQFWRRSPNWILADSDDMSVTNTETNFWPVKIDDKTIALRNLGNDHFCKRLTADGKTNCLNATESTISKEARLEVTELVLSREIYNVEFHPARAKIYNEHAVVMGSGAASNTTDKENSINVKVVRKESETTSWKASVSMTLGVKTTLVTKVPLIAEGKIEISAQLSAGYEWGKVSTKENTIETTLTTLVPPMTKVTVSAVGSTATCDVPYSYTQTDTLMDGTKRTSEMEDGMYSGINSFNVTYEIKHEKIGVN